MILINVRFPIRADKLDAWHALAQSYSRAVNAEPGCQFFELAHSISEPNTYVCIEGYDDDAAGKAHTQTQHFADFVAQMPPLVSAQPQIIYIDAPQAGGFGPMGEIQPA